MILIMTYVQTPDMDEVTLIALWYIYSDSVLMIC